jgi:hypothetical protein
VRVYAPKNNLAEGKYPLARDLYIINVKDLWFEEWGLLHLLLGT